MNIEAAAGSVASPTRRTYRSGVWAASILAGLPVVFACLTLSSVYTAYFIDTFGDTRMFTALNLFGHAQPVLALLEALALVVLMTSLRSYSPPGRVNWVTVGVVLAMLNALWFVIRVIGVMVLPLRDLFMELAYFGYGEPAQGIALMILALSLEGLALLCATLAFSGSTLERAARWCLGISGALLCAAGVVFVLPAGTRSFLYPWSYPVSLITRLTILPLGMLLTAVTLSQAGRPTTEQTGTQEVRNVE